MTDATKTPDENGPFPFLMGLDDLSEHLDVCGVAKAEQLACALAITNHLKTDKDFRYGCTEDDFLFANEEDHPVVVAFNALLDVEGDVAAKTEEGPVMLCSRNGVPYVLFLGDGCHGVLAAAGKVDALLGTTKN
jgi:hypothetical protein